VKRSPSIAEDRDLVQRARGGERAAFDALVERHMGMVYAIAFARLGDRDRAEDLAQEVFLRAFLALDQLSDPRRFTGWLSQITRNLAISWLRRDSRAQRLAPEVPLKQEIQELPDTQAKGARQQMETQEQESAIWKAIQALSPEERELVLLHFSEGISANEIARRLGLHQTTITRRLQRTLRRMRGLIEPVLREAAPSLRVSPRVTTRTLGVIAGAAAMSAVSKTALAAKASQEIAALVQTPAAAAGFVASLEAAWAALISGLFLGGQAMATGKGIASVVAAAAVVGGGIYVTQSGSQPEAPPTAPSEEFVPHVIDAADQVPTPQGSTTPSIYVVPPDLDPNADAINVPRWTEADWIEALANLDDRLAQGSFPTIAPDGMLMIHGSGITLTSLDFSSLVLMAEGEERDYTPEYEQVSSTGGPWLVHFDRPLEGQLFAAVYDSPGGDEEFVFIMAIEGAEPADPDIVAQLEQAVRDMMASDDSPLDEELVNRVRADMQSMATALEAYGVDWNAYPPSVLSYDPRNINRDDSLSNQMPGFAGPMITTPISYITHMIPDTFSATGQATFAYERFEPSDPWQSFFGDWVLLSPGVDRDWDLLGLAQWESYRMLSVTSVVEGIFDPTNGAMSNGDIVRAAPDAPLMQ
jgi:RNA polymerase sigma-70 factor, ECF subfamily